MHSLRHGVFPGNIYDSKVISDIAVEVVATMPDITTSTGNTFTFALIITTFYDIGISLAIILSIASNFAIAASLVVSKATKDIVNRKLSIFESNYYKFFYGHTASTRIGS